MINIFMTIDRAVGTPESLCILYYIGGGGGGSD